jgi:hypothetical protein
MKKLAILLLFAIFGRTSKAQIYDREFKPFKIDLSAGYGIPNSSNVDGGFLFAFEPKYAFTGDQLSLGLRLEGAMVKINSGIDSTVAGISSYESATNISALITGDYYFNNNNVRPFLGCGAGAYNITTPTGKNEGALLPDVSISTKFGLMFRGGIEWQHFRAGVEYNFTSNSSESFRYIGIKAGILLGGGRFSLISDN